MDNEKDRIYIIPKIKPITKNTESKKVTIQHTQSTPSSEMDLLNEVNSKLDILLTALNIKTKE